jgi:hypothetical protein
MAIFKTSSDETPGRSGLILLMKSFQCGEFFYQLHIVGKLVAKNSLLINLLFVRNIRNLPRGVIPAII